MRMDALREQLVSLQSAKQRCAAILAQVELDKPFNNAFIQMLMRLHPQRVKRNLAYVNYLVVRVIHRRRCLFTSLYDDPSNEYFVSLDRALRAIFSPQRQRRPIHRSLYVFDAFRAAVSPNHHSAVFFRQCNFCGDSKYVTIQYEEERDFERILTEFLAERQLRLADVAIAPAPALDHFVLCDEALRAEWRTHHMDEMLVERYICTECYIRVHPRAATTESSTSEASE